MKKINLLFLLCSIMISTSFSSTSRSDVDETPISTYVPAHIKTAIRALQATYPEINSHIDLSLFIDGTIHSAPQNVIQEYTERLIELLAASELKTIEPENSTIEILQQYLKNLETQINTRSTALYDTDNGLASITAGALNIYGGSNMATSGWGNTIGINLSNNPSVSGSLTAGTGLTATTGGLTVNAGGISSTGTTTLKSLGAGIMNTNSSGVVSSSSTTNHAVPIGNNSGTLNSLAVGTNGQVLLGATNANPAFATLTSTNGNIILTPGSNSLAIDTSGAVASSFPADSGTATPSSGAITLHGGSNITTSGSGSTVTVNLTNNPSVSGSLTAGTGITSTTGNITASSGNITATTGNIAATAGALTAGTTVTAGTGLTASSGNITATTGNITATAGALTAGTTVTAGTGLTATTGGLTVNAGGITSTGTTTLKLLGAGALTTSSSGVVTAAAGTNGQLLIGSSNTNPAFATLGTDGSIIPTIGAGTLSLGSTAFFGNVLRVDSVYGNDTNATANNKLPFKTINAAIGQAVSGNVIWLFPGTYAESFTIPAGVSIIGVSAGGLTSGGVRIALTNVLAQTDLVTMGENSRLENVSLTLSSSANVQLRGIVFPGTTSNTAAVKGVTLTVTNSGGGTANTYGIHSIGTGLPGPEISALRSSIVTVSSSGTQSTRGVLIDTGINNFNINSSNIVVTTVSGSAIGVQTNIVNASCIVNTSTVSGSTADISQTIGTLTLSNTTLIHATANGLGFSTGVSPASILWSYSAATPAGTTYMYIGTQTPAATKVSVTCTQPLIVKSLSVTAGVTPGATDTWTLLKNDIATSLTVSLTTPALSAVNNSQSVSFNTGDTISLQVTRGTAGSSKVVVVTELY